VENPRYRSYVVRIWLIDDRGRSAARVDVEEIQSGRQAELRDGPATALAAALDATLTGVEGSPPPIRRPG
jgi:hypothetical protein